MRNAIFPFLTIPDELVKASPWRVRLSSDEAWYDEPQFLERWDNGTDIMLAREIRIEPADVAEAVQLTLNELELELIVTAGTGAGRLPVESWVLFRERMPLDNGRAAVEVRREIAGQWLADALHLRTNLVLARSVPRARSSISPRRTGDVVWQDAMRIRLEGDVSQFPVTATDLAAVLGDAWKDALWYLEIDWDDMEAGFDTAARLLVNSRQIEFMTRFRDADRPTLQAVMADVMAQVVRVWLERLSELDTENGETGVSSIAAVAAYWTSQAFGSPESARHLLQTAPGRFHAAFNALAAAPPETGR